MILLFALAACAGPRSRTAAPASPATATTAVTTPSTSAAKDSVPLGPLPKDAVEPTGYAIELTVVPGEETFSGHAKIMLDLKRRTEAFWLHGRGLEVTRAVLLAGDGADIEAKYEEVHEDGVAKVTLAREAVRGPAMLEIDWKARFGERAEGLFHVEQAGRHYAFTQFEPLFARRMAPCFDEPAFKVPLELAVTIPRGQEAVSNAPTASTKATPDGRVRVQFEKTQPLPTYLWALAAGPLDVVSGRDLPATLDRPRKLPVRAIATKGQGPRLAYALTRLGGIVEALERDLGPFPYPKLDLIAVPEFGAGAMENAGAITFREWLLLLDGKRLGVDQLRAFESVTAHELAHQWFGDLVTMRWWDDLWLNEAFATWMETRVMDAVDPAAKAGVEALEEMDGAMAEDSLASSRRVRQAIESHHDVDNAFDGITYQKGAAVLAMVERWVGRAKFDAGVRAYLARHAHGNASSADLMKALSEAAGRDVEPVFASFLDQPGVPLVQASVSCADGKASVSLSQRRWLPLGSGAKAEGLWRIPVCLRSSSGGQEREQCVLLDKASDTVALEGAGCPEWVMPNADGAGYFRFSMDDASLLALSQHREKLGAREQLAVSDSLAAAFVAGAIEAEPFYRALEPLAASDERLVAHLPMEALDEARDVFLADRPGLVEARARKLFEKQAAGLEFGHVKGETEEARLRRAELAAFLLDVARHPALREKARALGEKVAGLKGKPQPDVVEPTLATSVLAVAVEEDGKELVEALGRRLAATEDADERRRALSALGHATGEAAAAARELALGKAVRGNELRAILGGHFSRPSERPAAWEWLATHFDAVVAKVPEEFVGSLPWYAGGFCAEADAAKVDAFFRPRIEKLSGGPRNLEGALESIRLCAARVARHRASTEKYFAAP